MCEADSSRLIANARMYAVSPSAAAAWRALFSLVSTRADVPLDIIDHAFPAPLIELWARDDLGCVFMCGWPYAKDPRGRHVLAVPVPSAEWARGQPVYRSDFVVSAVAPFATLSDCRGHRYAYTATGSHSGYNAPRASLAALGTGAALFGEVLGPYGTPRRAIEAVVAGEADVTGIDAYAYDLLCHHEPALARATRVIAASPTYPMPPLVASAGTQPGVCRALTGALVGLADDTAGRDLLGDLRLRGFAEGAAGVYASTLSAGPAADAVGYTAIR